MIEFTLFRRNGDIAGTAFIDDADADLLTYHWHMATRGYPRRYERINGRLKAISIHQMVLERISGPAPEGMVGEHKDRQPWNNLRSNLRWATYQQNMMNRRGGWSKGEISSTYKGVRWDRRRKRWAAEITYNRKRSRLGRYKSEEDAAHAYDVAARRLHGEFAVLNFP